MKGFLHILYLVIILLGMGEASAMGFLGRATTATQKFVAAARLRGATFATKLGTLAKPIQRFQAQWLRLSKGLAFGMATAIVAGAYGSTTAQADEAILNMETCLNNPKALRELVARDGGKYRSVIERFALQNSYHMTSEQLDIIGGLFHRYQKSYGMLPAYHTPEFIEKFAERVVARIDQHDPSIVKWLLEHYPQHARKLVNAAVTSIATVPPASIAVLAQHCKRAHLALVHAACDVISTMDRDRLQVLVNTKIYRNEHYSDTTLVAKWVENVMIQKLSCRELIEDAFKAALRSGANIPLPQSVLELSAHHNICQWGKSHLVANPKEILGNEFLLKCYEDLFDETLRCNIDTMALSKRTPTDVHLCTSRWGLLKSLYVRYASDEKLHQLALKARMAEGDLLNQDEPYYTYMHAHNWSLDFDQRIYTALQPSMVDSFFPLHYLTVAEKRFSAEREQRLLDDIRQKGGRGVTSELHLLSMNKAFFGNASARGECTAWYLVDNRSIALPQQRIERIFVALGHQDLYHRYKHELAELAEEHALLSKYGKAWVIGIPQRIHNDVVFLSGCDGVKATTRINGKFTVNVNEIQEAILQDSRQIEGFDNLQFRLIMTSSTGLNPHLGIKTIPITAEDPEKLKVFNEKFNAVLDRIKADIAAQQQAKA